MIRPIFVSNPTEVKVGLVRLELSWGCDNNVLRIKTFAINTDLTSDLEDLEHLLPTRKSGRSTKLKISAIDKVWNQYDKFIFKNQERS